MRIDPRHLIQFATIIEEGSFTRAARTLGLTQPALSKTVAYLEGRLGQPLLRSRRRPVEPTEVGRMLAMRGIQLRSIVDEAGSSAGQMALGRFGTLRVGAPPFFCEDVLGQIVVAHWTLRPEVWFEMVSAYAPELRIRVAERKLDVGIVPLESMAPETGLLQHPLADIEHAIFTRGAHAIDQDAGLIRTLGEGLWIGHSHRSILHGYAQNALARMGITQIRSFASSESGAGLIGMLLAVDAFAVLPIVTTLPYLRSGALKVIAVPPELPVVPLGLVSHVSAIDNPLVTTFIATSQSAFICLADEARAQARSASEPPGGLVRGT